MSDVAVIFGMQRCGSNYFLSACHRLDQLLVLGEMYHREGPYPFQKTDEDDYAIKQQLGVIIRDRFKEHAGEHFVGWDEHAPFSKDNNQKIHAILEKISHRAPNRYFDAIKLLAGKRRLLFKIFPEHLELSLVLAILKEQRPKVILLLRNPLDSFISYRKLVETHKPQDVDTSALKIKFNKIDYFVYKSLLSNYFRAILDYCSEEWLDVSVLHYEWLHSHAPDDKLERVKGYMEHVFGTPLQPNKSENVVKLFRKQDHSASAADKVLNPAQLPRGPQYLL